MAMKHEALVPFQTQAVEFRGYARLSAHATAVTIDREGTPGVGREVSSFDNLPEPLKIRVLAACQDAFRRRKEELIREGRERDV